MVYLKLKPVSDGHKKIVVNGIFSKGNFLEMNGIAKKNLSVLMQGLSIKDIKGTLDREISSITFDSRKAKKESLFVAVPGFKENGFKFINDSISQGATAFITEEPVEGLSNLNLNQNNVTAICVEDCRKALAWIGSRFYGQPSRQIDLFGVTGTNGKTTTTYILDSIYKAQKKISGIIGTIHYGYAGTKHTAPITTPESLDINRMLYEMTEQKISQCFLEVSSHSLSLKRVHGMHFAVGIFTNLSRDHLDFHKTMDNYKEVKKGLFRDNFVEKAVTNIDDPVGLEIANEFRGDLLTTSIDQSADVVAENYKLSESGSSFTLKTPFGSCGIRTCLLGKHNIYNLISAASAALINGIALNDIEEGLSSIDQIPGRFEKVPCDKGFSVVVDYAHTDDALRSVLRAAQAFTPGRIITVFGCGGDRDRGKRKAMGRVAIEESGFSIITSDNPRTENPQHILDDILEGVPSSMNYGEGYKVIIDRKEAIRFAIKQAQPGDLVMITGKGHENYQIVKTGKIHFDDREVAEEAMRRMP
jgi:UDP-N-acetylmuramoyl-L-alanyl-D-glutamate--2,6-diaminopimelate ligase